MTQTPLKPFQGELDKPSSVNQGLKPFDGALDGEPASRGLKGWAQDAAATGVKAALAVPEAAVGLADLVSGGKAGKALDGAGVRFKEAREIAEGWHSDVTKAQKAEFQNADGVTGKAAVALSNPSLIAMAVGESLGAMGAGGAIGRGAMAATRLGQMGAKGAAIAGAAGEGVVGAGSAAEQIRQETADGELTAKQAALAAGTGLATGALGFAGNKVANRLGIGDADMMLAQGTKGMAKDAADRATAAAVNPLAQPAQKSILRQMGEGAITEGVLEELPQSVSEQILQNEALGKSWSEGLDDAIVMGILSGGAMGAGAAGYRGFKDKQIDDAAANARKAAANVPGAATGQDSAAGGVPPAQWTTSAGAAARAEPGTAPASPVNAPNLDYETLPGAAPEAVGKEIPFEREFDTGGLSLQSTQPAAAAPVLDHDALRDKAGVMMPPQLDSGRIEVATGLQPLSNEQPPRQWDTGNLSLVDEAQPQAPLSQRMGLNPKAGALSKAAAMAVDSGASPVVQPQAAPVQQQVAPQVPAGVDPDTGEVSLQAQMDELKSRIAFMQQQGAAQGWDGNRAAQRNALQTQLTRLELQAAGGQGRGASTAGAPAPVQLTGINQILAKQIPDMNEQELQQAIAHYGSTHKRTKKLEKALQALAQKPLTAIESGANANVSEADQAQQGSAQPAQTGAAQAGQDAGKGVGNGTTPTANPGAQEQGASLAKAQAQVSQAAGAAQAAVGKAAQIAREGNAEREAQRQRQLDASERWTRMTTAERQAVAATAPGLTVIARKNVHTRAWPDLGEKIREKLLDSLVAPLVESTSKAPAATENAAKPAPNAVSGDALPKPAAQPVGDEKPFTAETGTLGIPRAEMPQVPTANHGGLVKHLKAQGISHETTTVDAALLKPTQAEYSPSKVEAAKTAAGDRAVIVSSDGHIIDGHHQAVAAAEEGKQVKAIVLDAPVEQALAAVKASPSANASAAPAPVLSQHDGEEAVFSTASAKPAKSMSVQEVQAIADRILEDLGIGAKVRLQTFGKASESGLRVPPAVVPMGATSNGKVYLFAESLGDPLEVFRVVVHEVFHLGLSKSVQQGAYIQKMLGFLTDPTVRKYADRWKRTADGLNRKASMPVNNWQALAVEESLSDLAEELVAERDGIGSKPMADWAQRMASRLARWADGLGLKGLGQRIRAMTQTEVEQFIVQTLARADSNAPALLRGGRFSSATADQQVANESAKLEQESTPTPSFRRQEAEQLAGADFDVASFLQSMDEGLPTGAAAAQAPITNVRPSYSPAARAEAVRSVKGTADAIRNAWANGPEVIVAFDMQDSVVPESARRADLKQRSGGARGAPEGFYYQGKVYLMASKLKTPNDAARVLFHEALGHHGLRGLFGKDLGLILNQVATMRKAEVDAKIAEYGLRRVNRLDRRTAAEEVLTEMAQNTPQIGFVRRAVAAIRTWLRTHVPRFKSLALTDDELIRNFILPARAWVERGAPDGGNTADATFSREAVPELRVATNFMQARQAVKEFQGKPLTNDATGMTAVLARNSLDKMLSGKAVEKSETPATHAMAVANADSLFKQAILGWSKPDRSDDANIKAIHRFFAPMDVNGRTKLVKLTVKEGMRSDRGNPLYTVEAVELNENRPGLEWIEAAAREDGVSLEIKNPLQRGVGRRDSQQAGPRATLAQPHGMNPGRSAEDVHSLAQEVERSNSAQPKDGGLPNRRVSRAGAEAPRLSGSNDSGDGFTVSEPREPGKGSVEHVADERHSQGAKENLLKPRGSSVDAKKASERSGSTSSGDRLNVVEQEDVGKGSTEEVADEPDRLLTLDTKKSLDRRVSRTDTMDGVERSGSNDSGDESTLAKQHGVDKAATDEGMEDDEPMFSRTSATSMPDAIIGSTLGSASSHPDYAAAKAGDIEAAVRLAQQLVTPELVAKVKAAIGDFKTLVVPVAAEEASGRNKIPRAAAEVLAHRLGLKAANGIVQANRARRTGMDGLDRIFAPVDFAGAVEAKPYLLVDDTLTQGGTFAALASHIREGGGTVAGVIALTGKQYSAKIQPSPETLASLRQKHGDLENEYRAATGYGFDALTESEARYLARYEPADRLRDRISDEGRRGREREDQSNPGQADPDADEGLRFSRSRLSEIRDSALEQLTNAFTHEGKVSLWDKSVGTMRHLAERAPSFKPVYESAQQNIDDVSMLANDAADMAPRILPRVESLGDLKKKPVSAADNKAVARPLFEGTLIWSRDENGKPTLVDDLQKRYANLSAHNKAAMLLKHGKIKSEVLAMWQGLPVAQFEKLINSRFENKMLKPGIVWTDTELQAQFGTDANQISLYREARAAIDRSIDMTARTDMLRVVGEKYEPMRDAVLAQPSVEAAAQLLLDTLEQDAKADQDSRDRLAGYMQLISRRLDTAVDLQQGGYAPLSRFGRYTVDVVGANGERLYFGMYETARDSNRAKMQLAQEFKGATVTTGTMSAEAYKLFAGVTPETLEQFGEMLGLKAEGNEAQDKAFQEFLKLTKNNHSAMKRLIHRKGIAGFSEDVGRVVANFVYSNARAGAMGLNAGKMETAIGKIPKEQGELKDLAMGLRDYIRDPQEEGQAVRGMLFAQYLGGSIASAFVNTTQPFAVTLPWLSQYGGMKKAGAQLARALKDMGTKGFKYEADLAKALQSAEDDGVVSPQEIHQLMAQARGAGMLRSGDGTKTGDLRAKAGNLWEQGKVLWGQPFALAEQFNRRSTFIASYRIAKDQGMTDPAAFARKAVLETQFVYSKANKPKWARGAVGGTLFTFKTYSVSYLELMQRMWNQGPVGSPERAAGRRAVGWALAMLLLMSGAGGVPFMEDAEDLIDGAGQMMGYNISAKQWRKELLANVVGKELGEFMEQGLSGLPGAPIDVSGRLGMGNLLPGTGLFLEKPNRERDMTEIIGPAGDLVARGFSGARDVIKGVVNGDLATAGKGVLEWAPTAVRNLAKGADMAATGMYRDTKGYKVIDTTLAEAAAKAIGFQPKSVAEVQEANSFMQRSKSFYAQTSSEIKAQWADALFRKDEAAVQRVRERLAAWNRDNPEQPIVVKMPDVWKRVREMGKDRSDRIADTAPKALREQMREQVRSLG